MSPHLSHFLSVGTATPSGLIRDGGLAPTDLPLNSAVSREHIERGERLRRFSFADGYTSPVRHAAKTCELAGFGTLAQINPDLVEWNNS